MPIYITTENDDVATGSAEDDIFMASNGNDELEAATGMDTLDFTGLTSGLIGSVTGALLQFSHANGQTRADGFETFIATDFADNLDFSAFPDADLEFSFHLGNGDDVMIGTQGRDNIFGGDGNDTLTGGAGDDALDGGDGVDIVDYSAESRNIVANLADGTTTIQTTSMTSSGETTQQTADDALAGGLSFVIQTSLNLTGEIRGDLGPITSDNINDQGVRVVIFEEVPLIEHDPILGVSTGTSGSAYVTLYIPAEGPPTLEVNISLGNLTAADITLARLVTTSPLGGEEMVFDVNENVDETTEEIEVDTLVNFESMIGGSGHDEFTGDAGANSFIGNGGNDFLFGEGGDDMLFGSDGHDRLMGGAGNDTLEGETGNDRLIGDLGQDHLSGGDGDDILRGGSEEDVLSGGSGDDYLNGGTHSDIVSGGEGNDTIYGGSGDDIISGGAGDDILYGHRADGTLTSVDNSVDTFVFGDNFGRDTIREFIDNQDLIDFSENGAFNSFADVLASASDDGSNLTIQLDSSNSLVIENFTMAELDASDFVF